MTTCYAVRVDVPSGVDATIPKLRAWLDHCKYEQSFFVLEHVNGENYHVQGMCLLDKRIKDATVRSRLKKLCFGSQKVGNGSYSLKKLVPAEPAEFPYREMERYLCKGNSADFKEDGPNVLVELTSRAIYSDELLESYHSDYWAMASEIKKRKVRMFDEVLSGAKRAKLESRESIARLVTQTYGGQQKMMSVTGMRSLTNLVYYLVTPDRDLAETVIVDMIMERRDDFRR